MCNLDFFVNKETCIKCGIYVAVCLVSVLEKDKNYIANFKPDFLNICLRCGQCMAVCSTKSVFANGLKYETDFFDFSEANDFFSSLEHRRFVRRFKPKAVENEKILNVVSQAPHGNTHHHVEITVVNSRNKIMEALPIMSKFYDKLENRLHNLFMRKMIELKKAKYTINTLKNHLLPRIEKGVYRDIAFDYDGITRGAHTILIFRAHEDSEEHKEDDFIFVTYLMLAAHELWFGSTVIGLISVALNKTPELRKMFNIPDNHDTVSSLIIGYPKYKYKRGIKRELKNVNWIY